MKMNIVGKCRELVHQGFDPTRLALDRGFQHLHSVNVAGQPYVARVADRNVVHFSNSWASNKLVFARRVGCVANLQSFSCPSD